MINGQLGNYAPATVDVLVTSTELVAADGKLSTVMLTNKGAYDVWWCHGDQTPVVGSGFFLPKNYGYMVLTGDSVPRRGIKAIADGGTSAVGVGKG